MLRSVTGKYKRSFKNNNGFTVIEVLVAMTILVIFITAFSALFVQSYTGILAAGNKNKASYDAQAEVEQRIAEENSDSAKKFTITFGSINININGGVISVAKTKNGQTSSMDSFLALIPTMTLQPVTSEGIIDEGYLDGLTIKVVGENTHFASGVSTLEIEDKNGMSAAVGSSLIITSKLLAEVSLREGLSSADGPYFITIKTGEEQVSAKLSIRPMLNYLSVGDTRKIAVSTDSLNWDYGYWGSDNNINCVTIFNDMFLAAGNMGKVVYSSNGYNWISIDLETTETATDFNAITSGSGKTVAVGSGGVVYSSLENVIDDSSKRTSVVLSDNNFVLHDLNSITFSGSQFVTVGDGGYIAYSTDGTIWTQADTLAAVGTSNLSTVTFGSINGESLFIAAGSGIIALSKDAVEWYQLNLTDIDESSLFFNSIVCANNKIVLATDSRVLTISDVVYEYEKDIDGNDTSEINAVNGTGILKTLTGTVNSIISAQGKYWAIMNGADLINSYDGAEWFEVSSFGTTGMNSIVIR